MNRTLVLVVVALVLGASGVVFAQHVRRDGVPGVFERIGFEEPASTRVTSELLRAGNTMDNFHARTGTFRGADLRKHRGVAIVFASDSAYCLQAATATQVYRLAGPGGVPEQGPC